MPLPQLKLVPQSSGYSAEDGDSVVRTKLDGGRSGRRKDYIGVTALVDVSFLLTNLGFDYLKAFYRTTIDDGSLPFEIQLILDSSDLTWYTAYFNTPLKLNDQQGLTYTVTAQLEVEPQPPGATADNATVAGYVQGT